MIPLQLGEIDEARKSCTGTNFHKSEWKSFLIVASLHQELEAGVQEGTSEWLTHSLVSPAGLEI